MVNTSSLVISARPGRPFLLSGNASRMDSAMDSSVPTMVTVSVTRKLPTMPVEENRKLYAVNVGRLGRMSSPARTTSS